jgi:LuxR family maltose regulon positive regulatory protein
MSLLSANCGVTQNGVGALTSVGEVSLEHSLAPLLAELSEIASPTTLILDDYQLIVAEPVHASISFFLEHLPASVRVVFGTRSDPPIPLSRLRARGRLLEIRAPGLAFNEKEAADLIRAGTSLSLSGEDLTRIVHQTEGWAMGLRAAAIALTQSETPGADAAELEGANSQMPELLREELFPKLPEGVKEFLVKTSFLDRLCPELCDCVLERSDSGQILELLDRADVFISSLDDSQNSFRVHPLVLQLLRPSLAQRSEHELIGLHRRASEWLAQNGQWEAAIRHSLEGEDWANAIKLIAKLGQFMVPTNRAETFKTWLSRIPREHLVSEPYACVQLARTLMFGNLHSDYQSLLDIAEATARKTADANLLATALSVRTQAECFKGNQAEALGLVPLGLSLLPHDELINRGMLHQVQSVSLMLSDRVMEAEAASVQGFQKSISGGNAHTACLALGMRGFINLRRGRLKDAYRYVAQAENLANSTGLQGLYILPFHRSRIDLESLKLADAESALREAEAAFDNSGYRIFTSSVHLNLARLKWMRGRYEGAEESLRIGDEAEISIGGIQDLFTSKSLRLRIALEREDWEGVRIWLERLPPSTGFGPRTTSLRATCALAIERGDNRSAMDGIAGLAARSREAAKVGLGADATVCMVSVAGFQERLGLRDEALASLTQAVKIAAPGGLYGPFWEVRGNLRAPLLELKTGKIHAGFVSELLNRLTPGQTLPDSTASGGLLTSKELDILRLLTQGYSNDDIARRTAVSQNTVKTHLQHIYTKLLVRNRTEAVAAARDQQIIP